MNKTKVDFKQGVIRLVINTLEKEGIKPKLVERLKNSKDVDRAYNDANRYARNYIHKKNNKKRNKFINEATKLAEIWVSNGNKWLDDTKSVVDADYEEIKKREVVSETNDEFLESIDKSDKSVENEVNGKNRLITNDSNLWKSMFGQISVRIKKEYIDNLCIDKVLIGYKDGQEVYFSKSVNGVFEVI